MAGKTLTGVVGRSFSAWSKTTTDDEYLSKLKFPNGATIYDQMRRSDPMTNAVLQAIYSQLMAASWEVEPASKDQSDIDVANFVRDNLFPGKREIDTEIPFRRPWTQTLRNICLFLPFGYMVLEKVFAPVNGKWYVQDLGPRLPRSIKEFQYDKQGNYLVQLIQKVSGQTFIIPAEKCLIFTFQKEGANATGISLLRPIYKPWAIKEDLEKLQAMMYERYAMGIPVGEVGEKSKPGDPDWNAMEEALINIGSNEEGYIVLPNGQKVSLLQGGAGAAPDIKAALQYYDEQIAVAWHAQFLNLGTTTSGNRALGDTFMDFFLDTVQSIGNYIADVFNNDLIPDLVGFNFSAVKYPQLKMLPLKEVDLNVVKELKKVGLITMTEATENRIRELVGINKLEEGEYDDQDSTGNEGSNDRSEETDPSVDEEDGGENDEAARKVAASDRKGTDRTGRALAEKKFSDVEIWAGVPAMEKQLDKTQEKTERKLFAIRDKQGRSIAEQAGRGMKPQEINVPHQKEMRDLLMNVYRDQVEVGKKQERDHAKKQGVILADIPVNTNELLSLVDEMIAMDVSGAANKLRSLLLNEAIRLKRQGIVGNALERALVSFMTDRVSDVTWQAMASTAVNGGWGDGRLAFVNSIADQVDHQIYSAILDEGTCDVCAGKDGALHAPNEGEYIAPSPECLGGDRCRCVNITFYKTGNSEV